MLTKLKTRLKHVFYMMIGVHDYDSYLAHYKKQHPDKVPMTRADYFRHREKSRFDKKNGCC